MVDLVVANIIDPKKGPEEGFSNNLIDLRS